MFFEPVYPTWLGSYNSPASMTTYCPLTFSQISYIVAKDNWICYYNRFGHLLAVCPALDLTYSYELLA